MKNQPIQPIIKTMLVLALALLALVACAPPESIIDSGSAATTPGKEITLFVGPERVDCVGVGPQQCLRVKFSADGEWELFYDTIEGFTFEPGNEYQLLVKQTAVENPPADGSALRYELLEVVTQRPVTPATVVLDGTRWTLVGTGDPANLTPPVAGTEISAEFTPDAVTGSSGCNGYGASYVIDGNQITFDSSGFASTLMACEDAIMRQEDAFRAALQNVTAVSIDGDRLTLTHPDGVLVFEQTRTDSGELTLEGPVWQFNGFISGDVVESPVAGTDAAIEFVNGEITGTTGCNRFFGSYTVDGDRITFGPLGSTKMACPGPQMDQEMRLLEAFATAQSFTIHSDSLKIAHAGGELWFSTQAPAGSADGEPGTAYVDSIDLALLESFPLQASLTVRGNLADGCTELVGISQSMTDDNTIAVTLDVRRPADLMCTQALVPFEQSFALDILGLPAGEYTVTVDGLTTTFTLDVDNVAPTEG